jgi:hypothetical protein
MFREREQRMDHFPLDSANMTGTYVHLSEAKQNIMKASNAFMNCIIYKPNEHPLSTQT